jgi:hypothetical protein
LEWFADLPGVVELPDALVEKLGDAAGGSFIELVELTLGW